MQEFDDFVGCTTLLFAGGIVFFVGWIVLDVIWG